ncbi:MAG: glycosyltransferase family protein [Lysinibacillus sp.]
MKVVAIIQARMSSTRLPGKILKTVLDKPLLQYQMERLQRCKTLDQIVIATTTNECDDAIIAFCEQQNIAYYRGSEHDVLARYYEAATLYEADVVVRITSDCPVIDPSIVDKVVHTYVENPTYDYLSNTLLRSYPRGMDTSLMPYKTLAAIHEVATDPADREHVTKYAYDRPQQFVVGNVSNELDYSEHRWTVDTIEDFEVVKILLEALYPTNKNFTMNDMVHYVEEHPNVKAINAHIEQKKV